jgi:hypothetical protein
MPNHIIYAKIFGLVSIVLALGILFNLSHAKKMANEMIHSSTGYIMGGVLPVIFGSWVATQHNIWALHWGLAVTLVGWFMLLIGIYRLWFVNTWISLMEKHYDKIPVLFALFGLMLGCMLCYIGFVSHHWL